MATSISIYENYNGKLFNDNFSHLEPYSTEYREGVEAELIHRGINLGIVEIRRIKVVPFARITEVMSFIICGLPLYYLAAKLNREYNQGAAHAGDKLFMHMVLGYTKRNIENQSALLQDWWASKSESSITLKK